MAAHQGSQAGQQLPGAEGLGQVVVSANLQANDAVHFFPTRRKHQDGQVMPGLDLAGDGQTVLTREHQIKHQHIG